MSKTIYLASRSPRRRDLLNQIGVAFQVVQLREDPKRGADVDEAPKAHELPSQYVSRIASTKAETAAFFVQRRALPRWPLLAADTTVVCEGQIMGKPVDADDAARMLQRLSGKQHDVVTAIAVSFNDCIAASSAASRVRFRDLTTDEIRRYVATGEPLDKAGAYAIQGRAAVFVTRIEGSYSGIVGLPLAETATLLAQAGIETP